ncbi:MAG TPA: hypothetical protein VGM39_15115 [Kofleriaceae bacterium]
MSRTESSLERWLLPSAEILTVGMPFCVFKLLTGLIALRSPALAPLGYALLALGSVDLLLNVANLFALLATGKRIGAVCLTDVLLRRLASGDSELGLAVDVFLSFGLVAIVIGFGLILRIPTWAVPIWNIAVVLNVLGAGVGRVFEALRRGRKVAA